jgi:hypothetical protein
MGGPFRPAEKCPESTVHTSQYKGLYAQFQLRFWTEWVFDSPLESKYWDGMTARMGCKGSRVQISASRPTSLNCLR